MAGADFQPGLLRLLRRPAGRLDAPAQAGRLRLHLAQEGTARGWGPQGPAPRTGPPQTRPSSGQRQREAPAHSDLSRLIFSLSKGVT